MEDFFRLPPYFKLRIKFGIEFNNRKEKDKKKIWGKLKAKAKKRLKL